MKAFFSTLLLFVLTVARLAAQEVGDSEKTIQSAIGAPSMIQEVDGRQVWIYPYGSRITFEKGQVVEAKGSFVSRIAQERKLNGTHVVKTLLRPSSTSAAEGRSLSLFQSQSGSEGRGFMGLGQNNGYSTLFGTLGIIITAICSILILIEAFGESPVWGLGVLVLPIVQTIFVFTHWRETKTPFLTMLFLGIPLLFAGYGL